MSQIEIRCVDQTAMFTNLPELFSGDVNIDTVKFTFDDSWNGYTTKTAVFYNNPKDVYPQILDSNNIAVIPSQVMTKECKLSIGVFGTKANGDVKTSKILTYNVGKGAINSDLESTPATPDFWTQLLSRQINFENTINSTVSGFETDITNLSNDVDTVEAIAKGRNQALAYNSYSEMITALNTMSKDELKRGQNIYIGTVGVPDLWVYGVETTKTTYTYTNDETFVNGLNNNVTVQVGYYKLAQLETQKVDIGSINTGINSLRSDVEPLKIDVETIKSMLVPNQVTSVSYTKNGTGYTLTWETPAESTIECVGYNIYKCESDTKPTSFSQYELIDTTTNLTYELANVNTKTFVLIASVSKLGSVNKNISNANTLYSTTLTFANASWDTINAIAQSGEASSVFSIGDTKSISINGTNYNIQIYDFDHDDLADGSGKAKMTLGLANCLSTTYAMNNSNTNSGGWGSCAFRTTLQNTILNQLPTELKSLIKTVKKKTSAGNQSTTINTTNDTLFLFSEVEVFGSTTHSVAGEGTQYSIFTSNSSRIKKQGDTGSTAYWWERSPNASNSTYFCLVGGEGLAGSVGAGNARNICFGFCI